MPKKNISHISLNSGFLFKPLIAKDNYLGEYLREATLETSHNNRQHAKLPLVHCLCLVSVSRLPFPSILAFTQVPNPALTVDHHSSLLLMKELQNSSSGCCGSNQETSASVLVWNQSNGKITFSCIFGLRHCSRQRGN
jgi:hypothetical protein